MNDIPLTRDVRTLFCAIMYYEIKSERIRRKKILINITPLIDVLFLLLIFFIVSSTFLEQPAVTVELPSAYTSQPEKVRQYVITVTKSGDIFINDIAYPLAELKSHLRDIAQEKDEKTIILKADSSAPYGIIIDVIDTARQCGLTKIIALTEPNAS